MSGDQLAKRASTAAVRAGAANRQRDVVAEFLGFYLAGERFALPLAAIREILKFLPITEVPRSNHEVLGILSVRGQVTTILDLRSRLRMDSVEPSKKSRILLVDGGVEIIGLLVDRVDQVYRLAQEEIEYAATVAGDLSEYVMGIGRPLELASGEENPEHEILILLDPEPLLET